MGDAQSFPRPHSPSQKSNSKRAVETPLSKANDLQASSAKASSLKALSLGNSPPHSRKKAKRERKIIRYKPLDSNSPNSTTVPKKKADEAIKINSKKVVLNKAYLLSKLRIAINPSKAGETPATPFQVSSDSCKPINKEDNEEAKLRKEELGYEQESPITSRKKDKGVVCEEQYDFIKDNSLTKEVPFDTLKLGNESDNSLEELANKLNMICEASSNKKQDAMRRIASARDRSTNPANSSKLALHLSSFPNTPSDEDNLTRPKYSRFHVFQTPATEPTPSNAQEAVGGSSRRCYGQMPRKDVNFASVSTAVMQKAKMRKQSLFWGKQGSSLVQSPSSAMGVGTPKTGNQKNGLSFYALGGSTGSTRKMHEFSGGNTPRTNTNKRMKDPNTNMNWGVTSELCSTRSASNGNEKSSALALRGPKKNEVYSPRKSQFYTSK